MIKKNIKLYTKKKVCDLCETKLSNPYKPINTKRNIFTFQCKKCLLIQSLPQKKFSSEPPPSMSFDADRSSIMYTKELVLPDHVSFFKKHKIDFSKCKSILDIGSNRGSFINYLKKSGYSQEIYAIETRKKLLKNYMTLKNVTAFNMRYEIFETNKKFDFIYNVHTLEHFISCYKLLEKMKNQLSASGKIFLAVPNINIIDQNFFEEIFIDPHTYHFTHNTIIKYFERLKLKIIHKNINGNELQYFLKKNNNDRSIRYKKIPSKYFDKKNALKNYANDIFKNRKKLEKKAILIKEHLKKMGVVVFWGAGRIFDAVVKIGKIEPNKLIRVVDRNLFKYFKKLNGFKLIEPNNLDQPGLNSMLVVCSRVYKKSIIKDAKKYKFKKIIALA